MLEQRGKEIESNWENSNTARLYLLSNPIQLGLNVLTLADYTWYQSSNSIQFGLNVLTLPDYTCYQIIPIQSNRFECSNTARLYLLSNSIWFQYPNSARLYLLTNSVQFGLNVLTLPDYTWYQIQSNLVWML